MTAFEVEELLKGAVEEHSSGVSVFAGAVAGEPEWPRVIVKVVSADIKSDAPTRARHSAVVTLQSRFDAEDEEGAAQSPAYTEHAAIATGLWERLEQREELVDEMGEGVADARLETYRADVDPKQGLHVSQFFVEVETQ